MPDTKNPVVKNENKKTTTKKAKSQKPQCPHCFRRNSRIYNEMDRPGFTKKFRKCTSPGCGKNFVVTKMK
jgi:hypothetical protein